VKCEIRGIFGAYLERTVERYGKPLRMKEGKFGGKKKVEAV
jgi:hypothetical protein